MADYTFHSLVEPLRNNSTIQTILDIDALAAPAKAALTGYVASLGLPAEKTQHLLWETVGVAVILESLSITYYLPSLGSQTPAPALRRTATLQDKVIEMGALESKFPKCQMLLFARNSPASNWVWLNTEVLQNSGNRVNTLKLIPYLSQNNIFVPGRSTQIGMQFIADPVSNSTLPQSGDRVTVQGSIGLDINPISAESKKNDEVEDLRQQIATLQLAVEGRLVNLQPNIVLGRSSSGVGTVEALSQDSFVLSVQGKKGVVNLTSLDLPLSSCWQLTNRSNAAAAPFDANNWVISNAFGGVKWLDSGATNQFVPLNTGIIEQVDPLYGTGVANKYRRQNFYSGSRFFVRTELNGVWGAWREVTTTAVA
jgi:hypothetical protein